MGLAQMSALGPGRKMKRPYVEEINRKKQFLPQLAGLAQEKKYQAERTGLAERRLAQDKKFGLENLRMREEMAHQARKKQRLAQNLGYANLGLQGVLGGYEALGQPSLPSLSDIGGWFDFGDDTMDFSSGMNLADAMGGMDPVGTGSDWFGGEGYFGDIIDWL